MAFGSKLWSFIDAGGYASRQRGDGQPCFYRFTKPSDPSCPQMLEFFARKPEHAPLFERAYLTPEPFEQQVERLSAILLDADYCAFPHRHTRTLFGVHVVTERALIPLKARGWLDLVGLREREPEAVDDRHIRKYRNFFRRLSQLLAEAERIGVQGAIRADLDRFFEQVAADVTRDLLWSIWIAPMRLTPFLRLWTAGSTSSSDRGASKGE